MHAAAAFIARKHKNEKVVPTEEDEDDSAREKPTTEELCPRKPSFLNEPKSRVHINVDGAKRFQ